MKKGRTMKRKLLFFEKMYPGGDSDLFRQIDYSILLSEIRQNCSYDFGNTGNHVIHQGILSELQDGENEIEFWKDEPWEVINEKYDAIIWSSANLLQPEHKESIRHNAELFSHSKIPIYIISVGAQADSYDEKCNLIESIKEETRELLTSIYNCGGEIGLRGYFTKEILDSIMPGNTAEVIGCPSIYQTGKKLIINNKKDDRIRPAFSDWGNKKDLFSGSIFTEYPESVVIDQGIFYREILDLKSYEKAGYAYIVNLVRKYGGNYSWLLFNNRIKLFYDVPEWYRFLQNGDYNFFLSHRIHGGIMAILAGIPTMVVAVDSRVREMAEFFNIPFILPQNVDCKFVEYAYEKTDYSEFNKNYRNRFEAFNNFLMKHNLVSEINENNTFINEKEPPQNVDFLETKRCELYKKHRFFINSLWNYKKICMYLKMSVKS